MSETTYLRAILAMVARQTFPPSALRELVSPGGASEKHMRAYNLCDGTRTQGEIARELGLDAGNFSRSLNRWVEVGIVIKVGEGREMRPLHVYPLPEIEVRKGRSADGD